MEVRIGVQYSAREITFESKAEQDHIADAVAKALAEGASWRCPTTRDGSSSSPPTRSPSSSSASPARGGSASEPPDRPRRARKLQAARPSVPIRWVWRSVRRLNSWPTLEVEAVVARQQQRGQSLALSRHPLGLAQRLTHQAAPPQRQPPGHRRIRRDRLAHGPHHEIRLSPICED